MHTHTFTPLWHIHLARSLHGPSVRHMHSRRFNLRMDAKEKPIHSFKIHVLDFCGQPK